MSVHRLFGVAWENHFSVMLDMCGLGVTCGVATCAIMKTSQQLMSSLPTSKQTMLNFTAYITKWALSKKLCKTSLSIGSQFHQKCSYLP